MKYFIVLLMALVLGCFSAGAQKLTSVKPYGSKGLYELTPTNDTVSVAPKYSASAYVMAVDTNMVIQADAAAALPCNLAYFQLTADATKRYVTFGDGFEAAPDSLSASKTRTWGFVYVQGKFVLLQRSSEY